MMGYNGYGYGMASGLGWIAMIAIFLLVILGIIALIRYLREPNHVSGKSQSSSALNILNERYVRGEIGDEEYKKKKSEIIK